MELKPALILKIVVVVVTVLFIAFFPQFYNSNDERNYIQNAYYLLNGGIERHDVPCEPVGNETYGFYNGEGCVSKYNIGLAIVLAPFVALHWQLSFVVTFAVYLLGIYLFYLLLRHHKIPTVYLFFYALYPPLVYYAARPMSEVYSHVLILLLYYLLFVRQRSWRNSALAGIVSGILILIRYSNMLLLAPLLVGWLYQQRGKIVDRKNEILSLVVAAAPFALLFFYINITLYGGPLSSGYDFSGETFYFDPETAVRQLMWYGLLSISVYPGLILIAAKSRIKAKWAILLALAINFLLYLGFPGFTFSSGVLNFVIGYRFYVPILGLVLLLYFDALHDLSLNLNSRVRTAFISMIVAILIANAFLMQFMLFGLRNNYRDSSDILYRNSETGDNVNGSQLLINEAFGKGIRYIEPESWVPLDERADILINE